MNAIEVRNVSKTYRLYSRPVDRLKEVITRRPRHEGFTALENLSFAVRTGETFGVIGENGAGKSTLLKILAGTLTPTSGEVVKSGRVAALLELGAGFHPEFTGRQNIHLNASLMGLHEREIRDREEGIIEFSELGDFIDRPVKTYSSGMYVRLAFSIATSVAPDILIIDEALSVGDQRFQQKCIERMVHFRDSGNTILFCSHSMYLVEELCGRAMWLGGGRVEQIGKTPEVVGAYLAHLERKAIHREASRNNPADEDRTALPDVLIEEVCILDGQGAVQEYIKQFQDVRIRVRTRRAGPPLLGHMGVALVRPGGELVFAATTKQSGLEPLAFQGEQVTELAIPAIPLLSGTYQVKAVAADQHTLRVFDERSTPTFLVSGSRPELGIFWMEHSWRLPGRQDAEKSR